MSNYSKSILIKQEDNTYKDINFAFNLSELEIEDQTLKDNMSNLNINSPEELIKYLLDHSGTGSSNKVIPFPCLNSNSIIYDGIEKTAPIIDINGEDYFGLQDVIENVNILGTKTAIDAGTYSLTFSLKDIDTSKWESQIDNSSNSEVLTPEISENRIDSINWEWNIYKALNNATVDKTSLNMDFDNRITTITVSNSPGDFTVISSDANICTVSKSGNTITVNAIKNGSATIYIKWTNLKNYNDKTISINVTVSDMPSTTLNDNSFTTVQKVTKAGLAPNYWNVGDKIGTLINGLVGNLQINDIYYAFILGFNHNASIEGGNSIHFQIGKNAAGMNIAFVDSQYNNTSSSAAFCMNISNTNNGGWYSSYMRQTICSAFLNAFYPSIKSIITACIKYTDNTGGGEDTASNVTTTSDKIWLLSEFEIFGTRHFANSTEQNYQQQYDYYKNGNSKIKSKHNDTTVSCYWWLRSPVTTISKAFCLVGTNGGYVNNYANYSEGFAPGFVVA